MAVLSAVCAVCFAAGTVSAALFRRAAEKVIISFCFRALQCVSAAARAGDFLQFFFADDGAKDQAAVFTFEMDRNNHKKTPRDAKQPSHCDRLLYHA